MLLLPCVTHFFRDSIQLLIHWYSSLFTIVNYSLNLQSYSNYSICARVVSFIHFQFYFIDRTAVAHGGATSTFGWTIHPKRKESKGQSRKDRILFFHSFNTTMNTWHNAVLAGTPLLWPSSCKQAAQPSSELVEWPSLGYWLSIVSRTVLKKKKREKSQWRHDDKEQLLQSRIFNAISYSERGYSFCETTHGFYILTYPMNHCLELCSWKVLIVFVGKKTQNNFVDQCPTPMSCIVRWSCKIL